MSRVQKLKKDNPEVSEAVLGIAEELDEKQALAAVSDTEGGKLLLKSLLVDVASVITALTTKYKEGSHTELIALCAKLDAKLSLYRALKKARKNKEELETILEEALNA